MLVLEGKEREVKNHAVEGVPSAQGRHLDSMRHNWANGSQGKRSPLVERVDLSGDKGGGLREGTSS